MGRRDSSPKDRADYIMSLYTIYGDLRIPLMHLRHPTQELEPDHVVSQRRKFFSKIFFRCYCAQRGNALTKRDGNSFSTRPTNPVADRADFALIAWHLCWDSSTGTCRTSVFPPTRRQWIIFGTCQMRQTAGRLASAKPIRPIDGSPEWIFPNGPDLRRSIWSDAVPGRVQKPGGSRTSSRRAGCRPQRPGHRAG